MDSPVARAYLPSLGVRKRIFAPRASVSAVVIHTTGSGVIRRWKKQGPRFKEKTPFDTAVRIYTRLMKAGGHYVVGQDGQVVQLVPEHLAAWHVGSRKARLYRGRWMRPKYQWWADRWKGYDSPLELIGGDLWRPYDKDASVDWRTRWISRHGSCNANTIGIEVVPPIDDPKSSWSDSCWRSIALLTADICYRSSLPIERGRILSHSDAHPISRTTRSGRPWDPWADQFSWETFLEKSSPYYSVEGTPPGQSSST